MNRGVVIAKDVVELLNWSVPVQDCWINGYFLGEPNDEINQIENNGFLYILSPRSAPDAELILISWDDGEKFASLSMKERLECFQRILKIGLSRFGESRVKAPVDWRLFHSGSLLSFQSNRFSSSTRARVYVDLSPEETEHVYVFALIDDDRAPLSRIGYDQDLFVEGVLGFSEARDGCVNASEYGEGHHVSIALSGRFSGYAFAQGVPYSVWVQSKLTSEQRLFFDAPFDGPMRLKGAAGTGKTLLLCLRFIKEVYSKLDAGQEFRSIFITHGQETADLVRLYLDQMDERGVLPELHAKNVVDVTTLHGVANEFINFDADGVMPLSLDGADGRRLQMELMTSIWGDASKSTLASNCRDATASVVPCSGDVVEQVGFLCDVIDEFSLVLESYGIRDIDQISEKYLRPSSSYKGIARSIEDKVLIFDLYKSFRKMLSDLGVVSLDQFISDFLAYLHSFRWDAVRARRGYDFVFADEIHLFNKQERQVFAYLMKSSSDSVRVALAYDPRQSPRSMFLPQAGAGKDSLWQEAKLAAGGAKFELVDVFRYTKEILYFLRTLNQRFPADDLSEELGLRFGESKKGGGKVPEARLFDSRLKMANWAADDAQRYMRKGEGRAAVLCLDQEWFAEYSRAGIFSGFVLVSSRDEIGAIQRYGRRPVLSTPELVAGLQFDRVVLLDANSRLLAKLGMGANGLQRFISLSYLGASRASTSLVLCANSDEGGFAAPIVESVEKGVVDLE